MNKNDLSSRKINDWFEAFFRAIYEKRSKWISQLVDTNSIIEKITPNELLTLKMPSFEAKINAISFVYPNLNSFIINLFKYMQEKSKTNINHTFLVTTCICLVNNWIDMYQTCEDASVDWMIPPLIKLLEILRSSGLEADAHQENTTFIDDGEDNNENSSEDKFGCGALRQTVNQQRVLNTIRQHIGRFRGDKIRQAGYIVLMSESIQLCIRLGNIQMASAFLKTVESSQINVSSIQRGPLVTFKYFLGKLYMQQEKFQKADEALNWSYNNCHRQKTELKKQIFECLVAVRLRMGQIPPKILLERYNLTHYIEIVKAIKTGNICRFEATLVNHMNTLIEEGTLLCVEKLKFIVYRTLFRTILNWAIKELYDNKPTNVLPIELFTAGFGWQMNEDDIQFDNEEMACIAANLIKIGYIKGYIAWEHRKIVLSKQTPLPYVKYIIN